MESKFHRWWLGCCVVALLLASWVGGFSVSVTSVFIVIYLTGVTLIGPDDSGAEPAEVVAPESGEAVAAVVDKVEPEPPIAAEAAGEGETPDDKKSADDETPAEETPAEETKPEETPADETKPETNDDKSGEDETPTEEPKSETPNDEKSADDDTAPAIKADAEADADEPADTETVIVYESAAATEQETVIVEDATDSDTEAVVTLVGDEDDALPYPDDFDDEAAAELGERSPT